MIANDHLVYNKQLTFGWIHNVGLKKEIRKELPVNKGRENLLMQSR